MFFQSTEEPGDRPLGEDAAQIDAQAALGSDLSRAWITARLMAPGIAHLSYPDPAAPPELTTLADDEYAQAGTITLTDAGVTT